MVTKEEGNGTANEREGTAPDPFDPQALRLEQRFDAGVRKTLLTVPVRKPAKEWWFRTHPDESHHLQTGVLELKESQELYLVGRDLWTELATEATFGPRMLVTSITRQGVLFLWPLRLPGADGRLDEWSRTALEAAGMARTKWCRIVADMNLGSYVVYETTANLPDPVWPDTTLSDLLRTAFKDRFINAPDHPVLRRLRGEL